MGIAVLGPLTIDGDGNGLAPRDKVVLEALAVQPGSVVTAEQIAEALWPDSPPATWSKVIQGSVVRLRKLLGPEVIQIVGRSAEPRPRRSARLPTANRSPTRSPASVVLYVGPRCHFVQYPLRGGQMFNQVAVFESPKAVAGEEDWGTPDELDAAFEGTCEQVQQGLPLMWRDKWWRMFDRDPIMNWVHGRIALLGDAAHPPLQYMAQGAIMAIEDGWVLAEHVGRQLDAGTAAVDLDWDDALAAYNAVRPEHCRRVLTTGRVWGELWHHDGVKRLQRNALLRARDTYDYTFTEWIYGPTALRPEEEPEMYPVVPLGSVDVSADDTAQHRQGLVSAG